MDKQSPRVSVVMSVYNGEKYLREAVDSILNQTFADFEFIIIDDGSVDRTAEILDGYTDPRIVRLKHEKNIGLARSLNEGIACARGEYIARMDADDISLPERFEKQIEYLDLNLKVGVLGTWIQYIDDVSRKSAPIEQYPSDFDYIRWRLCFQNPMAHSSTMIRRNLFKKEIYNADYNLSQDYDLWQRLIKLSEISNLREVLVLLRRHQGNVSFTYSARQQQFSFSISCMYISNLLQEAVPCVYIAKMLSNIPLSKSDSRIILELLRKIYIVFSKEKLSAFTRSQINKEYANRLFAYSAPYYRFFYFQKRIVEACFIRPALFTRVLSALFRPISRLISFHQTSL